MTGFAIRNSRITIVALVVIVFFGCHVRDLGVEALVGQGSLAGAERLELPTGGFGIRCSSN